MLKIIFLYVGWEKKIRWGYQFWDKNIFTSRESLTRPSCYIFFLKKFCLFARRKKRFNFSLKNISLKPLITINKYLSCFNWKLYCLWKIISLLQIITIKIILTLYSSYSLLHAGGSCDVKNLILFRHLAIMLNEQTLKVWQIIGKIIH